VRIVQLASFYGPRSGGLRTFVDEVGRRYGEAGHQRVLVVPGRRAVDELTPAGRRITLPGPTLPTDRGYRLLLGGPRLLALLDALGPDALEVSDRLLAARVSTWARARGVPATLVAHERIDAALADRVPARFPLAGAADAVNRRLLGRVDHVVVGSEFAAAEWRRVGGTPRVVRLGVDLDAFRPSLGVRPGVGRTVQLALVSRLSAEKRPELALAALRVLRARGVPAALLVLGDGPLRGRLERDAAGLPVRFLGHVADRRCLPHLVASADVTLAPAPMETFGLAVLESLACGTPVVVPTAGAARELVGEPGSGVVTDGTAVGLADGVESLLAVPAPYRRAAARDRAEQFPWSATVTTLLTTHGAPAATPTR
jgi:alpha-1,6-mannosyltransferase